MTKPHLADPGGPPGPATAPIHVPTTTPMEFDGVTIMPFTEVLQRQRGGSDHRGGPLWPDFQRQVLPRFCRNAVPVDDPPRAMRPRRVLDEPAAWAGPIHHHFGHQVADFSTRILLSRRLWPDRPMLFGATPFIRSLGRTPGFFRQILDWYGVERPVLVDRPLLVRRLGVVEQQEQLSTVGPSPAYLDHCDAHAVERLGRAERVGSVLFVSRARQEQRFAGEAYLDRVFADSGIAVMHPETLPIAEQLRLVRSYEEIVVSEGSALHALQLLGRIDGRITVLVRRSGSALARALLAPRVRSIRYLEIARGYVVPCRRDGAPIGNASVPLVDPDRVIETLAPLAPAVRETWNTAAFRDEEERSVREWLGWFDGSKWGLVPEARRQVKAQLAAFGLGDVAAGVRERPELKRHLDRLVRRTGIRNVLPALRRPN